MQYKGYIYCIRNKINNKKYIGATYNKRGYKSRWNSHINKLKNNKHENNSLQYDFNKYGLESFKFTIIEEIQANNLNELKELLYNKEKYYISTWNLTNVEIGYNLQSGGLKGRKHHEISKERMGKSHKNKKHNVETKKKMSESHKGKRTNYRKIQCVETGEIFEGCQDAIDKMFPGRSRNTISDHLKGKTKSAFKYHFKYID